MFPDKSCPKNLIRKREKSDNLIMDKNIKKLLLSGLLDFLLFHVMRYHKQFSKFSKKLVKSLNASERIVFNKFQV